MAQFDIHGFDKLMAQLDRLGQIDAIAPKMLEEATPILQEEVVKEVSKHKDTGDLMKSIEPTGVEMTHTGAYYICVRPTGTSSKRWQYKKNRSKKKSGRSGEKTEVRNMEKLVWLEFGVKGRAATPILTTATLNASPEVQKKLQEVFNREVRT